MKKKVLMILFCLSLWAPTVHADYWVKTETKCMECMASDCRLGACRYWTGADGNEYKRCIEGFCAGSSWYNYYVLVRTDSDDADPWPTDPTLPIAALIPIINYILN